MKKYLALIVCLLLLPGVGWSANLDYTAAQINSLLKAMPRSTNAVCDGTTDDSAAINAAIASGGSFIFPPGVTCQIESPLIVPSNTILNLNGSTIRQKASNNKYTMVTKAYADYRDITSYPSDGTTPTIGANAVEITDLTSSGTTVSAVTGSAHGLVAGDYVSVFMVAYDGYNGTYRVESAADTTHFTYLVSRAPHFATAVADADAKNSKIYCVKATVNVIIKNGTIDHNSNGTGGSLGTMAVMALGVYNGKFVDLRILNANKYLVYGGNLNDVVFEDIYLYNPNSDGIHLYGGSKNVRVNRISGYTHDDGIVVMTKDYTASFPYVHVSCGDMENIEISNIDVKSYLSEIALYNFGKAGTAWAATTNYAVGAVVAPTVANGYLYEAIADTGSSGGSQPTWPTLLDDTVADDGITWRCRPISYFYHRGTKLTNIAGETETTNVIKMAGVAASRAYFEDVTIDGFMGRFPGATYGIMSQYANFSNLTVKNYLVSFVTSTDASSQIELEYGTINNLLIDGFRDLNNRTKSDAGFSLIGTASMVIKKITYQNVDLSYRKATAKKAVFHTITNSTITHIVIGDVRFEYGENFLAFSTGSAFSLLELRSGTFINITTPLSIDVPTSGTIAIGSVYHSNSWGSPFMYAGGGALTVVGNMPILSSSILFDKGGSGAFIFKSASIQADVNNVSKTAGALFYNTSACPAETACNGSALTTGIVYCDGTSFRNIDDPEDKFWTP